MKYKNMFQKFSQNERNLLGIIILLVVVLVATYIYYVPGSSRLSTSSSKVSPFLNPAVALVDKKDLIVNFQKLRESLTSTYEARSDYVVSIYFEYFPTGANIAINKDEKVWPASLIKIPVAMAAMKKVESGVWKLSNELVILDEDKDKGYGELYKAPSGTTMTIRKFLDESLINSDNTAHFVLLRNIEAEELEDVYNHLGMDDIIDALKKSPTKQVAEDNRMTAKRYSVFFRSLYNATFLSQEFSQLFLEILSNAPRDLLGKGLPENILFVHKTGIRTDEAVRADSGIIYVPDRPYLLTVMIQKKGKGELDEDVVNGIFKNISEEVYTYVTHAH
jgi:beta-lactamase class A